MSEVSLWETLFLTFKVALVTTFFLLLLGTPLAYWISQEKKMPFRGFVSLPSSSSHSVRFLFINGDSPDGPLGLLTNFLG